MATGLLRADLVPSTETMLGWIEAVVAQGVRRPGYPADQWTERWIAERFTELGLEDVRLEPFELPGWFPDRATLSVWPAADPTATIVFDGFAPPHTKPTASVERQIVRLEQGGAKDKLAITDVALAQLPQSLTRALATWTYDPDGEFDELVQTLPLAPELQEVLEPSVVAGAAGFVGVLAAPWETCDYYVPYDGITRDIAGIWLRKRDGERIARLLASGTVVGRLDVQGEQRTVEINNVVGSLPGPDGDDRWVMIGSHHDAPWASAVEDGSGIAMVLAQAAYWSAVPAGERPHNMLFVLQAGHMVGGAGCDEFIRRHRDFLPNVALEVHLEHTARHCVGDAGGNLVPTDDPEPRWWFTTQDAALDAAVEAAIESEDLRRSFVLRPDAFGEVPPTDGGLYHREGEPLVNFLCAPMYLFDAADTMEKIHAASLEPVTRAAIKIIGSTRAAVTGQR